MKKFLRDVGMTLGLMGAAGEAGATMKDHGFEAPPTGSAEEIQKSQEEMNVWNFFEKVSQRVAQDMATEDPSVIKEFGDARSIVEFRMIESWLKDHPDMEGQYKILKNSVNVYAFSPSPVVDVETMRSSIKDIETEVLAQIIFHSGNAPAVVENEFVEAIKNEAKKRVADKAEWEQILADNMLDKK